MSDRTAWRASVIEPVVDPALVVIDPHHHLWPGTEHYQEGPYRLRELSADVESGHKVAATIYIDAYANYDDSAVDAFKPVGETRYAAAVGAESDELGSPTRICAGIVSNIDLSLVNAEAVLDAHIAAGGGRVRGVRQLACSDPTFIQPGDPDPLVYDQPDLRRGFPLLASRGLTFDSCLFHYQIPQLVRLARAFPETTIIMDHLGSPLGVGPYAGRQEEALDEWRRLHLPAIAACPNVYVKLGGQGMYVAGYSFHEAAAPPSSDALIDVWGDMILRTIDAFGPQRCMFESNFPVDALSCSYRVLWNAWKKLSQRFSHDEAHALLFGVANSVYRLNF